MQKLGVNGLRSDMDTSNVIVWSRGIGNAQELEGEGVLSSLSPNCTANVHLDGSLNGI